MPLEYGPAVGRRCLDDQGDVGQDGSSTFSKFGHGTGSGIGNGRCAGRSRPAFPCLTGFCNRCDGRRSFSMNAPGLAATLQRHYDTLTIVSPLPNRDLTENYKKKNPKSHGPPLANRYAQHVWVGDSDQRNATAPKNSGRSARHFVELVNQAIVSRPRLASVMRSRSDCQLAPERGGRIKSLLASSAIPDDGTGVARVRSCPIIALEGLFRIQRRRNSSPSLRHWRFSCTLVLVEASR